MLELYHMEGCPYCQKVRRKLEELDLDYISHPSGPKSKKREFLSKFSPVLQFPLLVDAEKSLFMFESDDICKYLEDHYRNSGT